MADAPDLGSGAARRGGSSPPSRISRIESAKTWNTTRDRKPPLRWQRKNFTLRLSFADFRARPGAQLL
jgi:hypothetical protein